jgi:hypothetical protein
VGDVPVVGGLVVAAVVLGSAVVGVGWWLRWPLWRPLQFSFDPLARLLPRPVTLTQLQRRVLASAVDHIAVGVSGGVMAPAALEVELAPYDLDLAGGTGDWLAGHLAEAFELAVAARGGSPRRTRVTVAGDERRPVGRPVVTAVFEPTTIDVGAWQPDVATRVAPPTTAPRPEWRLRSMGQRAGDESFDLDGIDVVVGRSRSADARVADPGVSGHHARLRRNERGGWSVADLSSTNGTFVNGDHVGSRDVPLAEGDELRLGTSTFQVERR